MIDSLHVYYAVLLISCLLWLKLVTLSGLRSGHGKSNKFVHVLFLLKILCIVVSEFCFTVICMCVQFVITVLQLFK